MSKTKNKRLGKLPPKIDGRTIKLSSILRYKLLPDLPTEYNLDAALGGIEDNFMYGNDEYGNCVIAARGHQTLRFEKFEEGAQPPITDQEVIDQYLKETGGLDMGLVLLNSLKEWRTNGWLAGGKLYNIYAFASVDRFDHDEVKHCIHLLGGVNYGFRVYQAAIDQFDAGEAWDTVANQGSYLGGHGVYLYRFGRVESVNKLGPVCMTWGKRQQMTWDFWDEHTDEAYGIVDNRNAWLEDSPVDVEKLDGYLREITAGNEQPSPCPLARAYVGLGNKVAELWGSDTRIPRPIKRY